VALGTETHGRFQYPLRSTRFGPAFNTRQLFGDEGSGGTNDVGGWNVRLGI
jgi:hypothetical protein